MVSEVKIIHGSPGVGSVLKRNEVNEFLSRKINIQIATIDEKGYPNIQPTWFYYDDNEEIIFVSTYKLSKKVANIQQNPNFYFSIDEDIDPHWCVKGKASVKISNEPLVNVPIAEKIIKKYLGSLDDPLALEMLELAKTKEAVVLEIKPKFFSTWNHSIVNIPEIKKEIEKRAKDG